MYKTAGSNRIPPPTGQAGAKSNIYTHTNAHSESRMNGILMPDDLLNLSIECGVACPRVGDRMKIHSAGLQKKLLV